jgi:hypothetical protein
MNLNQLNLHFTGVPTVHGGMRVVRLAVICVYSRSSADPTQFKCVSNAEFFPISTMH